MNHGGPSADRRLLLETRAAKQLREQLLQLTDDSDVLKDTIDGETNLHSAIHAVLRSMLDDEMMLVGIQAAKEGLELRKERYEHRVERKRAAITAAMEAGEIEKLTYPEATISMRDNSPKVVVTDEKLIAPEFWRTPDPVLDKTKLRNALNLGCNVKGAELSNGGTSISVRKT